MKTTTIRPGFTSRIPRQIWIGAACGVIMLFLVWWVPGGTSFSSIIHGDHAPTVRQPSMPPGLFELAGRSMSAQNPKPIMLPAQAKTRADVPIGRAHFGYSVSVSGDTAIIGAPSAHSPIGSAYVFVHERQGWVQQAQLSGREGAEDERFGSAVAIDGDTAIVGAASTSPGGSSPGSAYVFVRAGTTWTLQSHLVPSDGKINDNFGGSVAINGNTAVVGASGHTGSKGQLAGAVYIFTRGGKDWSQQGELAASDGAAFDYFGWSVAIDSDTVMAGAYKKETPAGSQAGEAYVFVRNGSRWSEQQKLFPAREELLSNFGVSVSLSRDRAVVGAHNYCGIGAAYVFVRSGGVWTQQARVEPSDCDGFGEFGWSVAIKGNTLAIASVFQSSRGAAYVFVYNGARWVQETEYSATDQSGRGNFGYSISLSLDTVVVGAPFDDEPNAGPEAGAAYFISATPINHGQ